MLTHFERLMLCDQHCTLILHQRLHLINSPEFQSVVLVLTAFAVLGKQLAKKNIILSNSTFYNLSIDI